ncbi:MAG: hypothetical protein IJN63_01170 [Clostridia bacterium]|nr:hypothetical protein [Clostridia bacterium]
MLKRITALLMLTVMLLSAVACATEGSAETTPAVTDGTTNPPETAPTTTGVYDTLKNDIQMDDMEFNVHLSANGKGSPDDFTIKDSGTVMDEAIFEKNSIMADKYGVILVADNSLGSISTAEAMMRRNNTAGENDYELCILSGYSCASLSMEGILYDLSEMNNINLKNTWWDQSAIRDLSIANAVFFTAGNLYTAIDDFTFCVLFNKDLYKEKVTDGTDLYKLVEEGKWTLDDLIRLSSLISEDLNGDDIMDSRDQYGAIIWDDEMLATLKAGGGKIATVNEDGYFELTMFNERNDAIVNKFVNFGNSKYTINFQHMSGGVDFPQMFTNGQGLFLMTMFHECHRFRDMETDYGIVPQPKFTTDQEWYAPIATWQSSFICVPNVCSDPDTISAIIELLGYHSQQILTPAFYEKTLHGTYIRDDESTVSLDIIFNNRIFDVGHIYNVSNHKENITNLLRNNNPTGLANVYNTSKRASEVFIKSLNKKIEKLKSEY